MEVLALVLALVYGTFLVARVASRALAGAAAALVSPPAAPELSMERWSFRVARRDRGEVRALTQSILLPMFLVAALFAAGAVIQLLLSSMTPVGMRTTFGPQPTLQIPSAWWAVVVLLGLGGLGVLPLARRRITALHCDATWLTVEHRWPLSPARVAVADLQHIELTREGVLVLRAGGAAFTVDASAHPRRHVEQVELLLEQARRGASAVGAPEDVPASIAQLRGRLKSDDSQGTT